MKKINYQIIKKAATLLHAGELVAFPTETVYGLGADASNTQAIERVFIAKARPFMHPLIVHLAAMEQLELWATDIPAAAYMLGAAFWPGPLTIILKKHHLVDPLITAGQDLVALRIPDHPITLALLQEFGRGIVGPSANRFCRISPTTAAAVREELGSKVAYIIPGGNCAVGIESTIVDLSDATPVILRPGMITAEKLSLLLQQPVAPPHSNPSTTRSAGMHKVHYAPETPVLLVDYSELSQCLAQQKTACAVLSVHQLPDLAPHILAVPMPHNPQKFAQLLYRTLRRLDKKNFSAIILVAPPQTQEWAAITDRIKKASNQFIAPETK